MTVSDEFDKLLLEYYLNGSSAEDVLMIRDWFEVLDLPVIQFKVCKQESCY